MERTDLSDLFILIVAFITDIIMTIETIAPQDFISTTGTIPYSGNYFLYGAFLGMGLLSFGLFWVVLLAQFRIHQQKRGWY
jgi:uncharacterized membrane protein